jgi:hypothetical protein
MKNLFIAWLIVLTFSGFGYGKFLIYPLEERVKNSDLIVIGTLYSVSKYETSDFEHSEGTIVVEKVISKNIKTTQNAPLESGDKIQVEWRNSKMFACKFNFSENEKGIWLLHIESDGTAEPLSPGSMAGLSELSGVKNHLRNNIEKPAKIVVNQSEIKQIFQTPHVETSIEQSSETSFCAIGKNESKQKEYYPFQALSVISVSIMLYYFLYRSKFKIR